MLLHTKFYVQFTWKLSKALGSFNVVIVEVLGEKSLRPASCLSEVSEAARVAGHGSTDITCKMVRCEENLRAGLRTNLTTPPRCSPTPRRGRPLGSCSCPPRTWSSSTSGLLSEHHWRPLTGPSRDCHAWVTSSPVWTSPLIWVSKCAT